MQQKVPFSLIRCSSSKVAFCSCVEWGWHIYNIVESESDPLTRRAVDLFEKEPLKGNSESTYIHPPSLAKIGQRTSEEIGNKQTDRQTDKRCSIYSMIYEVVNMMCVCGTLLYTNFIWHHRTTLVIRIKYLLVCNHQTDWLLLGIMSRLGLSWHPTTFWDHLLQY